MNSPRDQEKEELQELNKRLTNYIETVRLLEYDNKSLQTQVSNHFDYSENEINNIRNLYDKELESARALINELADNNTKFCIAKDKYKSVFDEANLKLIRRDKDVKNWEERARKGEALAIEFKSRFESLQLASQDNQKELINLRSAYKEIEDQLELSKTNLENEVYKRIELENKITTLKEILAFKTDIFEKEINLLKINYHREVERVISAVKDEEESRFALELQKIRQDADEGHGRIITEIEKSFLSKISIF